MSPLGFSSALFSLLPSPIRCKCIPNSEDWRGGYLTGSEEEEGIPPSKMPSSRPLSPDLDQQRHQEAFNPALPEDKNEEEGIELNKGKEEMPGEEAESSDDDFEDVPEYRPEDDWKLVGAKAGSVPAPSDSSDQGEEALPSPQRPSQEREEAPSHPLPLSPPASHPLPHALPSPHKPSLTPRLSHFPSHFFLRCWIQG